MVRLKSHAIAIIFLISGAFSALAQPANRQIVNQPLEWFSLTNNIKLSHRLNFMLEGQFRYASDFNPQQYQLRTALEVNVNKHIAITPLGYVYTWNYRYGKQPAAFANNEHRIWQQVVYKHKIANRLNLSHRMRLEQRFTQLHTADADGVVTNHGYETRTNRARYRFMATLPLKGQTITPKSYFLGAYDEAFLSWGKSVKFHEPDQNRVFAGVGYQFNSSFSVLAGGLYQMLIKQPTGAKQENNVGVQMMFTYNIDLTKTSN
jgi:hypothetical protein